MNRSDCINHLRAGHPMTHRVSRIIADMLEADGDALASAEEWSLLRLLAEIRDAMGVGGKPMLDELPGLVRGMKAERGELARALVSGPHHCPCPKFCNTVAGQERLPHLPGCPVALAERIVKEGAVGVELASHNTQSVSHNAGSESTVSHNMAKCPNCEKCITDLRADNAALRAEVGRLTRQRDAARRGMESAVMVAELAWGGEIPSPLPFHKMRGHPDDLSELDAAEMAARDINCPCCGGSGHVDDVDAEALMAKHGQSTIKISVTTKDG